MLIWQVLLLTTIVAGFGSAVYFQWRQNLFSNVDAELLSTATVLEGTLRGYTNSVLGPPLDRHKASNSKPNGHHPPRRRKRIGEPPRNKHTIRAGDIDPDVFSPPHNLVARRDRPPSKLYFTIFDIDNQVIAKSDDRQMQKPRTPNRFLRFDFNQSRREVVLKAPGRTLILVGVKMKQVNNVLWGFIAKLTLMGVGILTVGSIAGYWITGRAIAPIEQVSQTAQLITAANLGERIETSKMDSEFVLLSSLLNEMLDRLQETIEQQRRFIADASHELRTPVSVLGLHAELALSRERTPEEYKKTLQVCMRASERLKSLTEDLLTLTRSDSDQLTKSENKVELSKLVRESVEFLQPFAYQQQITLSDNCDSETFARGDERLLRQLIDNLLANAIVHNQPGRVATISAHSNGEQSKIVVHDDGPGIPADKLPNLFNRFYRVNASRTRENGGSGLGLSICASIARAHGGELTVQSAAAVGTTFEFKLPNYDDSRES